ncbi:MAG: hypothetical protein ONB43_20530 [candidate division KSB1 bacterium]|nr:hypothetical protein [candidate division KSB1 bacterium]
MTNFHIDSKAPLSLVLLAQPEFRKVVQLKALEAFSQRLTLRVHTLSHIMPSHLRGRSVAFSFGRNAVKIIRAKYGKRM